MGYMRTVSYVTSLQPIKGAMTSPKQSHGAAQSQKGLLRSTASCNFLSLYGRISQVALGS